MSDWLNPTPEEAAQRRRVMAQILDDTRTDNRILLPPFQPGVSQASKTVALLTVGTEPNPYGGTIGDYRYQFEGEDDLLHLFIVRLDGAELTPADGQRVAAWLLKGVPHALVWLKPGRVSQHFYLGHDDLIESLELD